MLFGGAAAPLGRALAPARHAATAHAVRPSVSSPAVRSSAAPLALPSSYPRTHHAQPAFAPPSAPAAPGTAAGCWGPPSPRGTAVFARAGLAAGGQGSAAGTGWRREEEDERIPVPEGAVPRRLKMVRRRCLRRVLSQAGCSAAGPGARIPGVAVRVSHVCYTYGV